MGVLVEGSCMKPYVSVCDSACESFLFFGDEKSFSAIGMASLPLSLTMPMPPSPRGVEMAAMVSSVIFIVSFMSPQNIKSVAPFLILKCLRMC